MLLNIERRDKMALRQRTWIIYTRPMIAQPANPQTGQIIANSAKANDPTSPGKRPYTGVPKVGYVTDLGGIGVDNALPILEMSVPGGEPNLQKGGSWVETFRTYSLAEVRRVYKELLKEIPATAIRIAEDIPIDTMIVPIA